MTYHPHVHMIVPGGGISLKPAPAEAGGTHWVHRKPGFLLPVRVLSRLFRRLFLAALADAHAAGRLAFFGEIADLRHHDAFAKHLAPLKKKDWFVYAKPPFSGPEAVLAYLARYTHRVAIANSRLIALDERGVTFRYKDYRRNGQARYRTMTLSTDEFSHSGRGGGDDRGPEIRGQQPSDCRSDRQGELGKFRRRGQIILLGCEAHSLRRLASESSEIPPNLDFRTGSDLLVWTSEDGGQEFLAFAAIDGAGVFSLCLCKSAADDCSPASGCVCSPRRNMVVRQQGGRPNIRLQQPVVR